jgi:hypothetical protein
MIQWLIPKIPMLAPLFEGMLLDDPQKRMTATEALTFFKDEVLPSIDDSTRGLSLSPDAYEDTIPWNKYDRWSGLPYGFKQRWSQYQCRPSLTIRILRWICQFDHVYYTVFWVRTRIHRMLKPKYVEHL